VRFNMDDAPELERVNPGRDMKRAESVIAMNRTGRVLPPKIALVAVITMIALHAVVPLAIVVRPPVSYAGALFLAAGAAMIIWSRRAFQAAGTPIRPLTESTVLICHGFYRWSRNPMYLGTVLLIAGVAILLGTLAPLLVVIVVFAVLQEGFIRREERLLDDTFGDRYRAYRRSVRRWL
jgi:protein-S-isoprenylcysteine O-methyltransferase Ste14